MSKESILLVDDDPAVSEGLAAVLQTEDRLIIICADVESAKIVFEQMPIDLLLTDVVVSPPFGYGGLDLVEFVARRFPGTSIAVMSGVPSPALIQEARKRGADHFLSKPFACGEVESILEIHSGGRFAAAI